MKILLAFFNGYDRIDSVSVKYPPFYESLISNLKKFGNELLIYSTQFFNVRVPAIEEIIVEEIKGFDPDICILFNNNFYDITEIVKCPIVI